MVIKHPFNHESLEVYRLAVEVNRWLGQTRFPASRAKLKEQSQRSSDSVVCNVAEGVSKRRTRAGTNSLRIALGEAGECCATLDCVDVPGGPEHQAKLRRIGAMLAKMTR